ncbi:hypothetical protein Ngar_c00760 [Candidatus Nitrososphaera gargensis Ga9.2]|uniref:Uncharacterized protein n=1 Tax=Nitrososphaera gargensis (strain Ga9.2) TaxID=1237085 RepID=K0I6Y6_NITGG|nr:hypothetical protein [Candidatus Nitrososphaera gargensis]AFU57026.1 hypothetical protein Ngar_c00760 [Candidatus Nitrososphaera gargensis Ga9.2]
MRKEHASNNTSKNKLLALAIAAALVASILSIVGGSIPSASAAEPKTINAGTGQGLLYYEAHRIPSSHWNPCFATSCDQGTGPGTWVWFVLFNDAGEPIVADLANEDGVLITGLEVGKTYFLQPTDCVYPNCGEPPHDVIFNNWHDCDDTRQRPFVIAAGTIVSGAAYYRYHLHGEPNEPVACFTTGTPNPPANNNPPPTNNPPQNPNQPTSPGTVETGMTDPVFYFKLVNFVNNEFGIGTVIAEENDTRTAAEILAEQIPDTNLSGQPLDSDSSLRYAMYNSLYEIVRDDPVSCMQIMRAAVDAGIPWDQLSDMQKAYIILKVKGSSLDATNVDFGNL